MSVLDDGSVIGILPDGSVGTFASIDDYTDAWYDMYYELYNEFEVEYPEYA